MPDVLEKCSVCQALLDEEDLFCANCGTEAPNRQRDEVAKGALTSTHNFDCTGCGASMSYDASAKTLRCPFCGSEKLDEQKDTKVLSPNRVVPFEVNRYAALEIMRKWLGNSFWRPGDLASTAVVEKMTAVYVPYWVFSARTFTFWTADSSQVPFGARASWYPVSGEHRGEYRGVLIGASGALTAAETSAICPFDLAKGTAPDKVDLENAVFEQFRVQRKYARPLAQQGLEEFERQACVQYVPGNCRNMKANVRMEGLTSEPVLVPVWITAYSYRDHVYRFLVNGQTGQATGQAPTDWRKIFLIIGGVILAVLLILLAFGVFSGVKSAGGRRAEAVQPFRAAPVSAILPARRSKVADRFAIRAFDRRAINDREAEYRINGSRTDSAKYARRR